MYCSPPICNQLRQSISTGLTSNILFDLSGILFQIADVIGGMINRFYPAT